MSAQDLHIFLAALNLNIPKSFGDFAEGLSDKDVMIEILIEDFTRYQS